MRYLAHFFQSICEALLLTPDLGEDLPVAFEEGLIEPFLKPLE